MPARKDKNKKQKNFIVQWIEIILGSLLLALIIRAFLFCGYVIPEDTMENTLLAGDVILAEKTTYILRRPRPGELVVFQYPLNPKKHFTMRCVAVGGQTVEIIDKILYVDGHPFPDPPTVTYNDPEVLGELYSSRDNFGPYKVKANSIFVMGDNRDEARDSRYWAEVPINLIEAKPMFIYFSWAPDPTQPEFEDITDIIDISFHFLSTMFSRFRIGRIGKVPK
jgi:signal peptidase I